MSVSARQNKKPTRKGRNPNNRERTVTTLTQHPNSSYLVPLTSEDPPMSSPFSVASSSAANNPSSSAYQPPSSYEAFGNADFKPQPPFFSQQQHQKSRSVDLPGKNDLERLQNLKNIIKSNQHSNYRPIPQPAALAAHYLGPIPTSQDHSQFRNMDGSTQAITSTGSRPSSPADQGRRPPRLQSKDWDSSTAPRKHSLTNGSNGAQPTNNTNTTNQGYGGRYSAPSGPDTSNIQGSAKPSSMESLPTGPRSISDAASSSPRFTAGVPRSSTGTSEQARISDDRFGHGESTYSGPRGSSNNDNKNAYDSKDNLRRPRENSWSARDGPPIDERRRDVDRAPPSPRPAALNGSGGGGSDTRSSTSDRSYIPREPLSRDDRFHDRDRERERERYDRDRRDWERDSRRPPYDRFRPPPEVIRRPPPEQRHYEPDYSDRAPPPRRSDVVVKEEPISDSRRLEDLRRPPTPMAVDRPPVRSDNDLLATPSRLPPPPPSGESRLPPSDTSRPPLSSDSRALVASPRAPAADIRPTRGASLDERHVVKPAPADDRRGPDVGPSPVSRPTDIAGTSRPIPDIRGARDVPATTTTTTSTSRPPIPLEDRISRPLQDRIGQPEHRTQPAPPPLTASRQEPGRPLEERLSAIPVSADSRDQRGRIPERVERPPPTRPQVMEDRTAARPAPPPPPPASAQDERRVDDRPGRYTREMSPAGERSSYLPARDDARTASKGPPSPRSSAREYRPPPPPRSISRERSATSYRPEDRSYMPDERRSDAMDVDAPSRYADSRSSVYNRPFTPPTAADLARDRARAAAAAAPYSPLNRPPHDSQAHSYDEDRRYPPGRDWQPSYQSSYGDRRREWNATDDEYYKSRQYIPPPPASAASERERYDRDQPPVRNTVWEARDDRDRREYTSTAPSPARSYDGPPRSIINSRVPDTYNSPASVAPATDRSYPPREAASYNRVRQRSLSPARRLGGPPIDDNTRPPAKRSRDEGYAPGDYYPPPPASSRDPGPPRRQENYPPLSRGPSPPPPSSSGSGYFDNRAPSAAPPPPPSSSALSTDRDYQRDYHPPPPPQSYDRPRSPPRGATYSRPSYSRDTRDDRRYPPPPPSSSMLPPRRP